MKHFFTTLLLLFTFLLILTDNTKAHQLENNTSKTLYVLNGSAETVSKINMNDTTIVKNIVATGTIPNRIRAYNDKIYIVSSGDDNIKVIDSNDDTRVLQIIGLEAGSNPWDITFVSTSKAYVSNYNANTVSVLDLEAGAVVKNIEVGQAPEGMIFKNGKLYVTNTGYSGWGQPYNNSSVSVIDVTTNELLNTISTPVNPQDLVFAPDGKLHVICTGDYASSFGKIAILDIGAGVIVDSILIGGSPGDIEITKDGIGYCSAWGDGVNGFLYSYNALDKTIINGGDNPLKIGPNLSQLLYDENENVLWIPYMTEWAGDGFIQKFDVTTNTVTWTSNVVGNGSSAVAIYEKVAISVKDKTTLPLGYKLEQNYPNPFNPTTTIRYQLPTTNNVKINIYDNLGNIVSTLVDEEKQAGTYTITFNAQNLSSGVYYMQFTSGNFIQNKKLILIK